MRRKGMYLVLSGGCRVFLERRQEMKHSQPSQKGGIHQLRVPLRRGTFVGVRVLCHFFSRCHLLSYCWELGTMLSGLHTGF